MLKTIWDKAKTSNTLLIILSFFYNSIGLNKKNICGNNNIISMSTAFLKRNKIFINGNNNKIVIKNGTRVTNTIFRITGDNHTIFLDEYGCVFNVEFWIEDNSCSVDIGKKTVLNGGHFAITEPNSKLHIGSNCLFSKNIEIRTGDSHSIISLKTGKRINYAKNVYIGDHVWVGANVSILKGVTIASDVIIANSAIVTKNIDASHSVAGGFPAKIFKDNVTWKNERIYE